LSQYFFFTLESPPHTVVKKVWVSPLLERKEEKPIGFRTKKSWSRLTFVCFASSSSPPMMVRGHAAAAAAMLVVVVVVVVVVVLRLGRSRHTRNATRDSKRERR
jgi:hypothetical protein